MKQKNISKNTKLATGSSASSGIEAHFDPSFATRLSIKEKQIQQNYRPVIGVHKWFARRPGTVFRSLLLSEFCDEPLTEAFWKSHSFKGVIADPFMGGGTPTFEANRLGFHTVSTDINPMAYWVVRQSLSGLDLKAFTSAAEKVASTVEAKIGDLYKTECEKCAKTADVKYFIWVKTIDCPHCEKSVDLFPGYLLSEDERHPYNVVACRDCGTLNEYEELPKKSHPAKCRECKGKVYVEGTVHRKKVECYHCDKDFVLPSTWASAPKHRLWAMEYHCKSCKPGHTGRFFKKPDDKDLKKFENAKSLLKKTPSLMRPEAEIPPGDETDRLHKWGYRFYHQLFNERQLLGLGILLNTIQEEKNTEIRYALLTVFSDILRYQNMVCRYDTYALKCQDIFSVHGFPVGLVQCENNLIGIDGVGSGAFRHFVEKYIRAKEYCLAPFETMQTGSRKKTVPIEGETILADLVKTFPKGETKQARIGAMPSWEMKLEKNSLDGVFTDPPYFDNVQYAELMDFCFHWLRLALKDEIPAFERLTTRCQDELTGNQTLGRGLDHFTEGLSRVFSHFANALKPGAPFAFTYHHNDPEAYLPLVIAILDAKLNCTAVVPVAAEMTASLHIANTGSSILDSVFVCRPVSSSSVVRNSSYATEADIIESLARDVENIRKADLDVTMGDVRCLYAGHVARITINSLASTWDSTVDLSQRMQRGRAAIKAVTCKTHLEEYSSALLEIRSASAPIPKEKEISATV